MRKRVFGSIFLTVLVATALTAGLLIAAFYSGLSRDVRARLRQECGFIESLLLQENGDLARLREIGQSYADRITLIAQDGDVLYDNRAGEQSMENHAARPEVREALETGASDGGRLSDTLSVRSYYAALRLEGGMVLRLSSTSESAFGALSGVSPWIMLVLLLVLLFTAILASWLTRVFLAPIEQLDLQNPLQNQAYDELAPVLQRLARQNQRIERQMSELSRRQAEFDDITARMDEGLVLFSAQGNILFANRAARALFPKDSASGSYLTLCRDAEYVRVVSQAIGGQSARGRLISEGHTYAMTASTVEEGCGHAAVLFLVDITQSEQAERQRQEFSANVSHELKTPLTSILGTAEIMENGLVQPADIGRFAGNIRTEARRLLALIEDILRLSRLDEGGAQEPFLPVELLSLSSSVCDRLRQKADAQQVTLTVCGKEAETEGVRRILDQMLFNLCDNAISYNRAGGSVTVAVGTENGAPFISVRDTGIGIAPADQARVFERFYRVDKSHSKLTGGTGLGLSIVKHGAALHGAEISLESEPEQGTTIILQFRKNN